MPTAITDKDKIAFLKEQFKGGKTPIGKVDSKDVAVKDPITLSEIRNEESSEEGWLEDSVMASRALLDGVFWGYSQETAASIAAAMYKTFLSSDETGAQVPSEVLARFGEQPLPTTPTPSYSGLRREMILKMEEDRDAWADDNFGLSLGLNVAGGFLTGSSVYNATRSVIKEGAKALTKAPVIKQGVATLQTRALQNSLGRMSALPASATALEASIAAAPQVGRGAVVAAAAEVPTLAATGALASVGFAPQGADLGESALTGAVISTVLGGPLTGVINYGMNGVTKNRIAQQLGKGRDFVPIGLASLRNSTDRFEKALNYGYNRVLKNAFGSDSLIAQQQKKWTDLADSQFVNTTNSVKLATEDAARTLARTKRSVEQLKNEAVLDVKTANNLSGAERKIMVEDAIQNSKLQAVADADVAVNAGEAAFRVESMKQAVPTGAPKELVKEVFAAPNMHDRQLAMNRIWRDHGFPMLKDKKFRVNPAEVAVKIKAVLGKETELLAALAGQKTVNAAKVIEDYLGQVVTRGNWIEGTSLNKLRNTLAEEANSLATEGGAAASRHILREMVKVLDDVVKPQLSKEAQKAFAQQQVQWHTNLLVREGVVGAVKRNGMFTPSEYLGVARTINKKAAQTNTSPLQREANTLVKQAGERDTAIKKLAKEQQSMLNRQGIKDASKAAVETERKITALKQQANSKVLNAESKAKAASQLETEQIKLANLKYTKDTYSKIEASTEASPFFKLFSTALLGFGNPIQGLATARTLGLESTQRLLAGQTQWQKALNSGLKSADQPVEKTVQNMIRGGQSVDQSSSLKTDSQSLNKIKDLSLQKQLQAYDKLEKAGVLDRVRTSNPKVYESLVRANATREQKSP